MRGTDKKQVKLIGIIGAGTIGASWAAYFLSQNFRVIVTDPGDKNKNDLLSFIEKAWESFKVLGNKSDIPYANLTFTEKIGKEYESVDFVQECVSEDLDIKHKLIKELELFIKPVVVIASSTSSLLCSDIQAKAKYPARIIVGHPYNPPHLIPLVEVIGGNNTSETVIEWSLHFYTLIGKKPIRANKERTGHIANRLTAALYQEAVYLVEEGIASVEDVDKAIKYGPGLRWSVMGPHMLYHLASGNGGYRQYLEHLGQAQENRWADLGKVKLTSQLVQKLVDGVNDEARGKTISELIKERDSALLDLIKLHQSE